MGPSKGFTLIEILVVLTLAAILTGVVIVGFTGAQTGQRLEGEAERVMLRMDLARQRAVQRNRELGMVVEPSGYQFTELDRDTNRWQVLEERPFTEVVLEEPLRLAVKVEGTDLKASEERRRAALGKDTDEDDAPPPDLVFFRSGELTPFTLTVATEDGRRSWVVSSDGLSGISMERSE